MITIHHLERSASERVVWLCEELELPYALRRYPREPTLAAPAAYKALHPLGAAPVIDDDDRRLAESGAIVAYLLARHGRGRLEPAAEDLADYLYWFHFANGTLQPALVRSMLLRTLAIDPKNSLVSTLGRRLDASLASIEHRLGLAPYFAGRELTAADVMMVFSLTTMRRYEPVDLAPYPSVRAYLARIGQRPAYRRAMAAADPQDSPLLA